MIDNDDDDDDNDDNNNNNNNNSEVFLGAINHRPRCAQHEYQVDMLLNQFSHFVYICNIYFGSLSLNTVSPLLTVSARGIC